jgi:hypothetical protein
MAHLHSGVLAGRRATDTVGLGHSGGPGPLQAVPCRGGGAGEG